MKISDILLEDTGIDEGIVWARRGNKIARKYRCASGPRKGRIVARPEQCSLPLDIQQSIRLRKTKAKFGSKLSKRSKKTKRKNPASRALRAINRTHKRKK